MSVKLLISGVSNSGKTTLTKDLDPKTTLVVSHDGKNYPYPLPHVNVESFGTSDELLAVITDKIQAFKDKLGHYPSTIVIDSVSKIFDTILDSMNTKHTGYKIYSELNREIHTFTDYIQNQLIASEMNVVLISHAIYDADTTNYNLVGKGDFQKRGGFLAEVDNAVFVETKSNKRIVHHKSTKFPARSILNEIPASQPMDDYSLANHINELEKLKDDVADFVL
jgi:hypothetical protein